MNYIWMPILSVQIFLGSPRVPCMPYSAFSLTEILLIGGGDWVNISVLNRELVDVAVCGSASLRSSALDPGDAGSRRRGMRARPHAHVRVRRANPFRPRSAQARAANLRPPRWAGGLSAPFRPRKTSASAGCRRSSASSLCAATPNQPGSRRPTAIEAHAHNCA